MKKVCEFNFSHDFQNEIYLIGQADFTKITLSVKNQFTSENKTKKSELI